MDEPLLGFAVHGTNCQNTKCLHRESKALAPLIIRWGDSDVFSDVLRGCARCSKCGRKGASLTVPSWCGPDVDFAPFPAD